MWSGCMKVPARIGAGIYVDGVLENSGTITALDTGGGSFSIGAFLGGGGYLNGLIDEVVIYNCAITQMK